MPEPYLLAHVLEVVVPGTDLGDVPSCHVMMGPSGPYQPYPIPSTNGGSNVSLRIPPPTEAADEERVVHITVFDSAGRTVGVVVIPVDTLVPSEVWNVWYAMDDEEHGGEDEQRPPEEAPKMHLLLQYVDDTAASLEDEQLRAMRAQDFLFRGLQLLNAELEARVSAHHSAASEVASTGKDEALSGSNAQPISMRSLQSTPGQTVPLGKVGGLQAQSGSGNAALRGPTPASENKASVLAAGPVTSERVEEIVRRRLEPYREMLNVMQQKQKFYQDQEAQVKQLSRSLEVQEQKCHDLYSKLYDSAKKYAAELATERENARQTQSERQQLEHKTVELKQEVSLRVAHEDSLQKRVALMENELSVVHQKCVIVDTVEEQVRSLKKEASSHLEERVSLQERLEEEHLAREQLHEEMRRRDEEGRHEINKLQSRILSEKQAADLQHHTLQDYQDIIRDKEAEKKLHLEKVEGLTRDTATLENEVSSYKNMWEREKEHRMEIERKFEEAELKKFAEALDAHERNTKQLREQNLALTQELIEKRARAAELEVLLSESNAKLGSMERQYGLSEQQLHGKHGVEAQCRELREENDQLKSTMERVLRDARKTAEHYEHELAEHSKNEQLLCKERDVKQHQVSEIALEASKHQLQAKELRASLEQKEKELEVTKPIVERYEDFRGQLEEVQKALRESYSSRDALHAEIDRITSKFREHIQSTDDRLAELERTVESRNSEIKLLMYRVQELSSKYTPVRSDPIDVILARWINGYRPAVPFFRLAQGLYLFGRRQVIAKVSNDKPVFRVGGGFIGFDRFLELYASEELERLLTYETDEETNAPKFSQALRFRQQVEASGVLDELREQADRSQPGKEIRAEALLPPRTVPQLSKDGQAGPPRRA